ncbi:hypothetical protein [Campylobacter portucalensis]|nr:hypothetical protein [Campylobacter portucalensis]
MKKIAFCTLICSISLSAVELPDMSEYDNKFSNLQKTRVGLSDRDILSLTNPFIPKVSENNQTTQDSDLIGKNLEAIILNSAKINGVWYKLGDSIGSYELVNIKNKSVIIKNKEKELELKLNQGNKNVVITYK